MRKPPKRPRDPAQLAKLMIDTASGEVEDRHPTPTIKVAHYRLLGGGSVHFGSRLKVPDRF